ncbi:hypothetical protein LH460_06230 [Laribacter hongkongensis]|uniref:hypothetical protein n=1 Tax=Laribacter hongkongensis TaxID=168471 RepID=UPI001EFED393|nr:hypothetical protein [Laribacter hongkongensis]MCG9124268.1 hypothetical protein [Laribacter hongkongensis]
MQGKTVSDAYQRLVKAASAMLEQIGNGDLFSDQPHSVARNIRATNELEAATEEAMWELTAQQGAKA